MSKLPAVQAFCVAIDPARDLERDRRSLEHTLRIYDNVADSLRTEAERVRDSDGSFDTKELEAQMGKLEKALMSAIEIQGRIKKRIAALEEADGEGGIDLDRARDEVRRRLARLAERARVDGFS